MSELQIPKFSHKYTTLFFERARKKCKSQEPKERKAKTNAMAEIIKSSLSVRRESESSLGRGELAAQWVRDIAQERAGLGITFFHIF